MFFIFGSTIISQDYQLVTTTESYVPLSGATTIYESNPDSINISPIYNAVPIGFEFKLRNIVFDSINFSENGFAVFRKADTNRMAISIFTGDLFNFQGSPSLSPINYATTGTVGNRIFKSEYVNSGFTDDLEDDDFINVQLWLYESCSNFEIRVGPNSVNSDVFWNSNNVPWIGLGSYEDSYSYLLFEGPTNPTLVASQTAQLDSIPYEGLVYHFSNCFVGTEDLTNSNSEIKVFPNPSKDRLNINFKKVHQEVQIIILDLKGRIISNQVFYNKQTVQLNNESLTPGVYLIQVKAGNWIQSKKWIKLWTY